MKTNAEAKLKLRRPPSAPREDKPKPDLKPELRAEHRKPHDKKEESAERSKRKTGIGFLKPSADKTLPQHPAKKRTSRERVPLEDLKQAKEQAAIEQDVPQESYQQELSSEDLQRLQAESELVFKRRMQFQERSAPVLKQQLQLICRPQSQFEEGQLDELAVNDFLAQFYQWRGDLESDEDDSPRTTHNIQLMRRLEHLKSQLSRKAAFERGQGIDPAATDLLLRRLEDCEKFQLQDTVKDFLCHIQEQLQPLQNWLETNKLPPLTSRGLADLTRLAGKNAELRSKLDTAKVVTLSSSVRVGFLMAVVPFMRSGPIKIKELGISITLPKLSLHRSLIAVIEATHATVSDPPCLLAPCSFRINFYELTKLSKSLNGPFSFCFEGDINPNVKQLRNDGDRIRVSGIALEGQGIIQRTGSGWEQRQVGPEGVQVSWPETFHVVLSRPRLPFYKTFFIKLASYEQCLLEIWTFQNRLLLTITAQGVSLTQTSIEVLKSQIQNVRSWVEMVQLLQNAGLLPVRGQSLCEQACEDRGIEQIVQNIQQKTDQSASLWKSNQQEQGRSALAGEGQPRILGHHPGRRSGAVDSCRNQERKVLRGLVPLRQSYSSSLGKVARKSGTSFQRGGQTVQEQSLKSVARHGLRQAARQPAWLAKGHSPAGCHLTAPIINKCKSGCDWRCWCW